ncbi:MAG: hypothetical protein IJW18_08820 [Lachnospiraceae bacterium]|nr:hypothetical protein [Lachnospiraceae bacterium]
MVKKILCFGDSNTWGHDPENGAKRVPDEYRWPRVLEKMLPEEYIVIEEGLCGRWSGSPEFKANDIDVPWNGYQYFLGCFRSHKPVSLVVIMLGTNDLQKAKELEPEYTGKMLVEYVKAIEDISALSGDAVPEILLVSPIAIDESIVDNPTFNEIFGAQSLPKSAKLAGVVEEAAKQCGVHYFKAEDYAVASKLDGLHMNSENHKLLAKALSDKVLEILK